MFGGKPKVDTSAYEKQTADAKAAAEEAQKAAAEATAKAAAEEEAAKKAQKDLQDGMVASNKAKRATASNRFSLMLFEPDSLGS